MKRRSQEEWKSLIQEQQESNQSVHEFCEDHAINAHYFSCVKSKFKKTTPSINAFQSIGSIGPTQGIALQWGAARINLPVTVDAVWLATLAKHLA